MEKIEKIVYVKGKEIPLKDIEVSAFNVRNDEPYDRIEELKNSIQKFGLILPVVVIEKKGEKEKYELIVGQRRFLAFEQLGKKTIPANIIKDVNDESKMIASFAENMHRRELSFNDTVAVCEKLFDKYEGNNKAKIAQISKDIGIGISTVSKYLGYKLIPEKVRDLVDKKLMNHNQAVNLTETLWPDTDKIEAVAKKMAGRTRSEWRRALNYSKKKKAPSVNEIIDAAEKIETTSRMTIEIDKDDIAKLKLIAKARSEILKREVEINDVIEEVISDFIKKTVVE